MSGCGCGGVKCRLTAGDERHGTASGYSYAACRCDDCKAYRRQKDAARYARTAEQVKARVRAYSASERGREVHLRAQRIYRSVHSERISESTARRRRASEDAFRAREGLWRRSPEGRASRRARCRRRREREQLRYCGCDTRENLAAVWLLDAGLCAYCGAEGTDYEHVVPLARGGWGCVSNFRVACKSCNSRKGTKPLAVFLERLSSSGVKVRPGATNSGLPCPAAAERMARRALTA